MSKISDSISLRFSLFTTELNEYKNEFSQFVAKTEARFNKLFKIMDGLAGDFKKFDEEQTVMSYRQSNHSDRIEKLEEKIFGISQA